MCSAVKSTASTSRIAWYSGWDPDRPFESENESLRARRVVAHDGQCAAFRRQPEGIHGAGDHRAVTALNALRLPGRPTAEATSALGANAGGGPPLRRETRTTPRRPDPHRPDRHGSDTRLEVDSGCRGHPISCASACRAAPPFGRSVDHSGTVSCPRTPRAARFGMSMRGSGTADATVRAADAMRVVADHALPRRRSTPRSRQLRRSRNGAGARGRPVSIRTGQAVWHMPSTAQVSTTSYSWSRRSSSTARCRRARRLRRWRDAPRSAAGVSGEVLGRAHRFAVPALDAAVDLGLDGRGGFQVAEMQVGVVCEDGVRVEDACGSNARLTRA